MNWTTRFANYENEWTSVKNSISNLKFTLLCDAKPLIKFFVSKSSYALVTVVTMCTIPMRLVGECSPQRGVRKIGHARTIFDKFGITVHGLNWYYVDNVGALENGSYNKKYREIDFSQSISMQYIFMCRCVLFVYISQYSILHFYIFVGFSCNHKRKVWGKATHNWYFSNIIL